MQKSLLYCCGYEQPCKVYEFPSNKLWKRLYFLDECSYCGTSVASLQECDYLGNVKILVRRSGNKAIKFRDKMLALKQIKYRTKKGSLENERVFYNDKGIVYNFNNRIVGKNEDFYYKYKNS